METVVFLCVLLASLMNVQAPGATVNPYPPTGKLVDIGGYRLHLNCTGRGSPVVVLIAGGGDFSFDWSLVQPETSKVSRVCSYDRGGLAWSDPGPTPRTMRQDAFELHALLKAAGVNGPYVLVGHSIGGLIARVYADAYPKDVAGIVLVDPTHEDTTLMYQGKLVRVRDAASGNPIPPPRTLEASPPTPPTKEDLAQFEFNKKLFGAPRIEPPFDKLPPAIQAMRLWFLARPPRSAGAPDFWAEELQAMYTRTSTASYPLRDVPLVVLLAQPEAANPPQGVSPEEWQRVNAEKRQQKISLTKLSRNSRLIVAEHSGHHIQLDEPHVVIDAIRSVLTAVRTRSQLDRVANAIRPL